MSIDVFISYPRADRELAAYLARKLEERGITSWYDARVEAPAEANAEAEAALKDAKVFALLFADDSNKSARMRRELTLADAHKRPVVPFLLENTSPRGTWLFALADRNWINAYPEPMSRIEDLAGHLARLLGRWTPPPPPAPIAESDSLEERERRLDAAIGEMIRDAVDPAHAPPNDLQAYVGLTDGRGRPVKRLGDGARMLLAVVTLGAYGAMARQRAIRAFRANIRKL